MACLAGIALEVGRESRVSHFALPFELSDVADLALGDGLKTFGRRTASMAARKMLENA